MRGPGCSNAFFTTQIQRQPLGFMDFSWATANTPTGWTVQFHPAGGAAETVIVEVAHVKATKKFGPRPKKCSLGFSTFCNGSTAATLDKGG